jgi:ribose transport system substrate-binding protein
MSIRTSRLRAHAALALTLAVAAVTAAAPTALAQDASGAPATLAPVPSGEELTIAYIQTGPFDYYQRGVDGAVMAAPLVGATIAVLNSDLKPEKEIANVEDAISQGVDGIILFSVGRASEEAALAKAKEAGIPVAVLYGYAPELEADGAVFMQADITQTGAMAGQWVAENVPSGKVAVIQGALGRGDAEAYTTAFKEAVAANPELEVVGEPAADWARDKALAAMQDLLTANPDLAAVFVQNEDMALGAIQAIKAAGASTVVVSQNGSPDGLTAIGNGEIAATVGWSPAQEAQMALARLVTAIRSGSAPEPKLCHTPLKLVTADNLAEAYSWVPTDESTAAAIGAACGA